MKIEKLIITKAKWSLFTDKDGFPVLGYYGGNHYGSATIGAAAELTPGVNMILKGPLMLNGTMRGRSSAEFAFKSKSGWSATTSMTGTETLLGLVGRGECSVSYETWVLPSRVWDGTTGQWHPSHAEQAGPVFDCYWVVSKQGTAVALTPVSEEFVQTAKPY